MLGKHILGAQNSTLWAYHTRCVIFSYLLIGIPAYEWIQSYASVSPAISCVKSYPNLSPIQKHLLLSPLSSPISAYLLFRHTSTYILFRRISAYLLFRLISSHLLHQAQHKHMSCVPINIGMFSMQHQVMSSHRPVSWHMLTYVQHSVLSRLIFGNMLHTGDIKIFWDTKVIEYVETMPYFVINFWGKKLTKISLFKDISWNKKNLRKNFPSQWFFESGNW